MAKPGPPPKPTRLKLLHGNPGRRKLNPNEPQLPVEAPACPAWLNAEAKKAWKAIVPLLKKMGVLAKVDRDALAAYCQTLVRWRQAEEFLDRHGLVYPIKTEKGAIRCMAQFPQVAIARNLLLVLRGYQQEFGLTPSARSRLSISGEREPSAYELYLASKPQPAVARPGSAKR